MARLADELGCEEWHLGRACVAIMVKEEHAPQIGDEPAPLGRYLIHERRKAHGSQTKQTLQKNVPLFPLGHGKPHSCFRSRSQTNHRMMEKFDRQRKKEREGPTTGAQLGV